MLVKIFTILIALICFGLIVFIHEFGHFSVAKLCGIKVNEFAIGMGPAIFHFQKGETKYSLRILPFGGYCAMEGEDEEATNDRAFRNKSVPQRFAVTAAGAINNIILGFFLAVFLICMDTSIASTTIGGFRTNESGESIATSNAWLEEGDVIVEINGMSIWTTTDLSYKMGYTAENDFTVVVKRNGEKIKLEHVTFLNTENQSRYDFYVKSKDKTVWNVLSYGFKDTVSIARVVLYSIKDMIRGTISFQDMSGPVGVINTISEVATLGETLKESTLNILYLVMQITINLGIFNLLPIPALDGGRLFFLLVEGIRRKPIPAKKEALVHAVGLALLFTLMIAVSIKDIISLF